MITSNLELADAPGNVLNRDFLTELAGALPARLQASVDAGLRLVLQL